MKEREGERGREKEREDRYRETEDRETLLENREREREREREVMWAAPCKNVSGHMRTAKAQVSLRIRTLFFLSFFIIIFFYLVYCPFKNISLLFWTQFIKSELLSSRSFIKGGRKPENPGKNHLTIRKQNMAFPHVTRAGFEPQR